VPRENAEEEADGGESVDVKCRLMPREKREKSLSENRENADGKADQIDKKSREKMMKLKLGENAEERGKCR
jgi:hypothetical protein